MSALAERVNAARIAELLELAAFFAEREYVPFTHVCGHFCDTARDRVSQNLRLLGHWHVVAYDRKKRAWKLMTPNWEAEIRSHERTVSDKFSESERASRSRAQQRRQILSRISRKPMTIAELEEQVGKTVAREHFDYLAEKHRISIVGMRNGEPVYGPFQEPVKGIDSITSAMAMLGSGDKK